MELDIGAKRPIDGDKVFLVGGVSGASEPSFVLLHDASTGREKKRNLMGVDPAGLVAKLGGDDHFLEFDYPTWGTVWFRRSKIRRIVEMPTSHAKLSSAGFGVRVLFDHDPDPPDDSLHPYLGFSLHGVSFERASSLLEHHI